MSLFIFNNCKKAEFIGLENTDVLTGTVTDTVTIFTKTVTDVPVRVDNNFFLRTGFLPSAVINSRILGYVNDPVFGQTSADLFTQIRPGSEVVDFDPNIILDSAVVIIPILGFYGDTSSSFRVNIFELNEGLVDTATYFSNRDFSTKPLVIGTKQLRFSSDSVKVAVFRGNNLPDTFRLEQPQIRIPLDINYARNTFVNAPAGTYDNLNSFRNYFKGIAIKINQFQSFGTGGLATVDVTNFSQGRILFYYRRKNNNVETRLIQNFFFDRGNAQSSKFTNNFSGTPVAAALANPSVNQSVAYIKPLGGVKTKITFPFLQNLKAQGNIAINKAELLIKIQPGSDARPFNPAPFIYMNRGFMPNGSTIEVPDGDILDLRFRNDFDGRYDPLEKVYRLNVTRLVQDLLTGKTTDDNLFLTLQNTATSAERLILNGGNAGVNSIKLRITYTQ